MKPMDQNSVGSCEAHVSLEPPAPKYTSERYAEELLSYAATIEVLQRRTLTIDELRTLAKPVVKLLSICPARPRKKMRGARAKQKWTNRVRKYERQLRDVGGVMAHALFFELEQWQSERRREVREARGRKMAERFR